MRKSRLSKPKQARLVEHFVAGTTSRRAADRCGVNRASAVYFYHRLRAIIVLETEAERQSLVGGMIEVDESYFGGVQKGRRGRGAVGKTAVFGLLKRGGKVYTQVISDASANTLRPIIRSKVKPDSVVYSDH